jgi:hypothetical protein
MTYYIVNSIYISTLYNFVGKHEQAASQICLWFALAPLYLEPEQLATVRMQIRIHMLSLHQRLYTIPLVHSGRVRNSVITALT